MFKNKNVLIYVFALLLIISLCYNFYCKSKMKNNFISHTDEPCTGEVVYNNNPNCKHYNSVGIVINVDELDNDMGKVIIYKVLNNGTNYKKNDVLIKTMDQLTSLKSE